MMLVHRVVDGSRNRWLKNMYSDRRVVQEGCGGSPDPLFDLVNFRGLTLPVLRR
jgi:hypothetical protein